jgi:hypothetical protein
MLRQKSETGMMLHKRSPFRSAHDTLYMPWLGFGLVKAVNHSTYAMWEGKGVPGENKDCRA